jgi:hypothetical protein
MEAMRSTAWSDDRLDDLNHKVDRIDQRMDERFNLVDARFNELESRMDTRFNAVDARFDSMQREMNARFDSMQRGLFHAAIVLAGSVLTAGAAIVATQI